MTGVPRRVLAKEAMLKSIDVRIGADIDLSSPLDVYALCDKLSVPVRFVGISMEGMYVRASPPRIFISALRPPSRRVFTCAHELGHHVFGHGSTIDELASESAVGTSFKPKEFLVQSFAGFLLMPTLGVKKAFAVRGWNPANATPAEMMTVACTFGAGYATLVSHMAYGLTMLSPARAAELLRVTPGRIRRDILGAASSAPLIVADHNWSLPTIDAEVATQLLLPPGAESSGHALVRRADLPAGRLFDAIKPGIVQVYHPDTEWAVFVRVSRCQYVGLSRHRHLEDTEDEEERDGEECRASLDIGRG